MHIGDLAREACAGVTVVVARACCSHHYGIGRISMGTPGMRYSLVSREIIADSIEAVAGAAGF